MRASGRWLAIGLLCTVSACSWFGDDAGSPPPVLAQPVDGTVTVALDDPLAEISRLIRGVSGQIEDFADAGVTLNSWGGTRATRYNYQLGNAWNLGREGAYRNEGAGSTDDLVGDWLAANEAAGVVSRVAVPGLGWVARDGDSTTCSFPDGNGDGCLNAVGFDCRSTGPIADPTRANVGSSPATVGEWIDQYASGGVDIDYLAVDNEPERWGIDHYDVHPTCSDYFEILGTYRAYAESLRSSSSRSLLAGPVMCCWFEHLDPPGPDASSNEDLLSWFLTNVSESVDDDEDPLLDVVDVHFRPQADVVNSRVDDGIDRLRVESTRELWDPEYLVDGLSTDTVEFVPRVRRTIDETFPGMPLMISDWRFGGEDSMSGALAISEALGVFAREGVHAAAYAEGAIEPGSPGYFAFKLFGNYDDRGGAFEGMALPTTLDDVDDVDVFAAVDGGTLRLMFVNPTEEDRRIGVDLGATETSTGATMWTYSEAAPDEIVRSRPVSGSETALDIAANSVSMFEVRLRPDSAEDDSATSDPASTADPDNDPDPDDDPDSGAGTVPTSDR